MGTHEARPGPVLAPPGGAVLPAARPAVPPMPPAAAAPGAPAPPVLPLPPPSGLPTPSGSSGLVPVRPGPAPAAAAPARTPAPSGFVPGAAVTTGAAVRLRWDQPRARTKASATTFGLTGRVVITVVVVLVVAVLSYGNPFGIPLFLAAAAWLLRDLWARARHVPPVPAGPSGPGRPAPSPSLFATSEPAAAPSARSFPPPGLPPGSATGR